MVLSLERLWNTKHPWVCSLKLSTFETIFGVGGFSERQVSVSDCHDNSFKGFRLGRAQVQRFKQFVFGSSRAIVMRRLCKLYRSFVGKFKEPSQVQKLIVVHNFYTRLTPPY